MKRKQNNKSQEQNTERLKEISKWTHRYAQNRVIPFLVQMAIFLLFFTGIAVPSYLAGKAYRSENILVCWICIVILAPILIALFCFSFLPWGRKVVEQLSQRLYGKEGSVSIPPPERIKRHRWAGYTAVVIFICCIPASVILGHLGYITIEYMQPVSAIYVVPFLVFLFLWQRPMVGPLMLLWPMLYGIHAILVVAGVPIQFSGQWQQFNMIIPVVGYGILSGLVGYIYSRRALKKIKQLTRLEGGNN